MVVSNRNRLFQGSNFRGYVSFREGTMVVFDVHTKFNYVHIYIYISDEYLGLGFKDSCFGMFSPGQVEEQECKFVNNLYNY